MENVDRRKALKVGMSGLLGLCVAPFLKIKQVSASIDDYKYDEIYHQKKEVERKIKKLFNQHKYKFTKSDSIDIKFYEEKGEDIRESWEEMSEKKDNYLKFNRKVSEILDEFKRNVKGCKYTIYDHATDHRAGIVNTDEINIVFRRE